jgi:hypothetical protein
MRMAALFVVAMLALSAGAPARTATRTLIYQFGYNTKVADAGNGTGTETIVLAPAPDGGVTITGTDSWWNSVRPRATNTCELHSNGGVACTQAPYALSPIQLTLFPLLARNYFKALAASATSNWTRSYTVKAAILPGSSGFAGQLSTWQCTYQLHGQGPIPKGAPMVLVLATGTLAQQGGRYLKVTSKERISYNPVAGVPYAVNDVRTNVPQRSIYSNDYVQALLVKDSR